MPEIIRDSVVCPVCGSNDTIAVLGKDDYGIIWCSCGKIEVNLGEGMEVHVVRS